MKTLNTLPLFFRVVREPARRLAGLLLLLCCCWLPEAAFAQQAPNLGSAARFAILAGSNITSNTPVKGSTLVGAADQIDNLVTADTIFAENDGPVPDALSDLAAAKVFAWELGADESNTLSSNLAVSLTGGGIYVATSGTWIGSNGTMTLSGDSSTVYIFNIPGNLTFSAGSMMNIGSVRPGNIFWNVEGEVIIAGNCHFYGVVMSTGSIQKAGYMTGKFALLSSGSDIILEDINEITGHNTFYSYRILSREKGPGQADPVMIPPCTPPVQDPEFAPNLVFNGGFELLLNCPDRSAGVERNQNPYVCGWRSPNNASPDYYHACGTPGNGVPTNRTKGNLASHTVPGAAYVGMQVFGDPGWKEYIDQQLPGGSLQQNRRYYAEFYASSAYAASRGISNLGIHFSNTRNAPHWSQASTGTIEVIPQIEHNNHITSSTGWARVGGSFIATGQENFITIGNFRTDANTNWTTTGRTQDFEGYDPDAFQRPTAYYLLDDVALYEMPTAGNNVTITCGGIANFGLGLPLPLHVGATYTWTANNDPNFTANGLTLAVQPAVNTTYTLTITINGVSYTSSASVTISNPVWAHNTSTANYNATLHHSGAAAHQIGKLGEMTDIWGFSYANSNYEIIFDGIYHVRGPITFKTYPGHPKTKVTIKPGTQFHIDGSSADLSSGSNNGYPIPFCSPDPTVPTWNTFIILENTDLEARGATFEARCDVMWGGFWLKNNSTIDLDAAGTTQCIIRDANVGILSMNSTGTGCYVSGNTNNIFVSNTRFLNYRYAGIVLKQHENPVTGEKITNCEFACDYSVLKKFPERGAGAMAKDYGAFGIYLGKEGLSGDYSNFAITGNTFSDLKDGIYTTGPVTLSFNTFQLMYGNAIISNPGLKSFVTINNNTITVPAIIKETPSINPFNPVYGITAYRSTEIKDNIIYGAVMDPSTSIKEKIGVQLLGASGTTVLKNFINSLDKGVLLSMTTTSGTVSGIDGNSFTNNIKGVEVSANSLGTPNVSVRCNDFSKGNFSFTARGLDVRPNASMNSIGTLSVPAGNRYFGINEDIVNQGQAVIPYYLYDIETVNAAPFFPGFQINLTSVPGTDACRNLFSSNNGVNRVQGTSHAAILEMMDSLKHQVGSQSDFMYYQNQIMKYHMAQNQVPALDAYVRSLHGFNATAHKTLGVALMDYYREELAEAQAQSLKSLLLQQYPQDQELYYRAQYFDLTGRIGSSPIPKGRPTLTDSLELAVIAGSGTAIADAACYQLRGFFPRSTCGQSASQPDNNRVQTVTPAKAVTKPVASLEAAYPNPAQTEITVPCLVPIEAKQAGLIVHELVTGRVVKEVELSERGQQQAKVELANLKPGIYSYTLIVDGKRIATKKLFVLK